MNILNRIIGMLIFGIAITVGIAFVVIGLIRREWIQFVYGAEVLRPHILWTGAALIVLGLLFVVTGFRRRRRRKFLAFDNEGGTVSISTEAIADYVSKLSREFPSIIKMRPEVVPGKGTVDIVVDVNIKAGPQIHEICETVQQRVRESLANGLGISEVRRVEVNVRDIASEHIPG
jgi:uncharacterized alkaline shock family protein YloU